VPVALKITGDPVSPVAAAVRLLGPAAEPSVHDPTVAIPDAFVVAFGALTEPPPLATANTTATPATAFPFESVTFTEGAIATALPATAVCASPPLIEIDPAEPGVAVAVNVMTRSAAALAPLSAAAGTATVAVTVFGPATFPRRQLPTVATPSLFVV
jgi:hypothetical protein